MPLPSTAPHRPAIQRAAPLLVLLVGAALQLAGAPAQAACGTGLHCVTPGSVKNAAGVPPDLLQMLAFKLGSTEVATAPATLQRIAAAWQAKAKGRALVLVVSADARLRGAEAKAQATARAAALQQALQAAGIPAASVQVSAR